MKIDIYCSFVVATAPHHEYLFPARKGSQVYMVLTYCGMDQKSLIDFCSVLLDMFFDVLDVQVKRGAELSADHHVVARS